MFSSSSEHSTFLLYLVLLLPPRHILLIIELNIVTWFVVRHYGVLGVHLGYYSVWKKVKSQGKAAKSSTDLDRSKWTIRVKLTLRGTLRFARQDNFEMGQWLFKLQGSLPLWNRVSVLIVLWSCCPLAIRLWWSNITRQCSKWKHRTHRV